VTLPTPQQAERMTGSQIMAVLRQVLDQEREDCARLADACAERMRLSGKVDHGMVAVQLAAQIRARATAGPVL
jgi:hypothetical protein